MSTRGIGKLKKELESLEGLELIKQDIRNLFQTRKGERVMRSSLGIGLSGVLFEPADSSSIEILKTTIRRQLSLFEPRVQILSLEIEFAELDSDMPAAVIKMVLRPVTDPTFTDILRIPVETAGGSL